MRIGRAALGIMMTGLFGSAASAEEICTHLRALLGNPPSGFVALRAERTSSVWPRWSAKPFLPNATCEIIGSDDGPDSELRCLINENSQPGVAATFYEATRRAIDQCLPGLPHGRDFVRDEEAKNADGFEGLTTRWVHRSRAMRFEIELTNDRVFGNARNSLVVKFQKL